MKGRFRLASREVREFVTVRSNVNENERRANRWHAASGEHLREARSAGLVFALAASPHHSLLSFSFFSTPLHASPFLVLDFRLLIALPFRSHLAPFSSLKDLFLSFLLRVRFNFYERLPPRSLVIACLAVTLRADSASRYRNSRRVASRRVECSFLPFLESRLSFFFLSFFLFLCFLAFCFRPPPISLARCLPSPFHFDSSRIHRESIRRSSLLSSLVPLDF